MANQNKDDMQFPGGNDPNKNDWKKKFSPGGGGFKFSFWFFLLALGILALLNVFFSQSNDTTIEFSTFKELIEEDVIQTVKMTPGEYTGYTYRKEDLQGQSFSNMLMELQNSGGTTSAPRVYKTIPINDPSFVPLMEENNVDYYAVAEKGGYLIEILIYWIFPIVFFVIIWRFLMKRMGGGANVMSFGQSSNKVVAEKDLKTRFRDVAGCEESKEELIEVVDFLKNAEKYKRIGGKIPKGVLLVGPPGTGKTLMARAVAGEAGVTFFKMSGAEFVEMFVGVGASRVRDLFKQAREKSPCIIFIDELDAIGKSRAGNMSTNDEREQTLNQLLVEMDGFDSTTGVILIAATNRPEVLDPALLRPGRFDRQVLVDKPDLLGREAILKIHSVNVKMDESVDLKEIAKGTPGFVGADLANIVNEAALLAVRAGRQRVSDRDFNEAIEKVMIGLEKKNRLINPREREIVAYHETGHALVRAFTPDSEPVHKISIVPRGMGALGYTMHTPTEDRFLMMRSELLGRIDVLLGGRAAEEIIYGAVSTGASNDIMRATDIARSIITEYGMSDRFQNMTLTQRRSQFLDGGMMSREYSDDTQKYVDQEIARIVEESYKRVKTLVMKHKDLLCKITDHLMDVEILSAEEFLEFVKQDEKGAEELKSREKKDMKPSEKAIEKGKKRNDEIIARNKARREKEEEEIKREAEEEERRKTSLPGKDDDQDGPKIILPPGQNN